MKWGLMNTWKAFMTLSVSKPVNGKLNGSLPSGSGILSPHKAADDLDLHVTVNGCNKRWSVGSESNGDYAAVLSGLEADLEKGSHSEESVKRDSLSKNCEALVQSLDSKLSIGSGVDERLKLTFDLEKQQNGTLVQHGINKSQIGTIEKYNLEKSQTGTIEKYDLEKLRRAKSNVNPDCRYDKDNEVLSVKLELVRAPPSGQFCQRTAGLNPAKNEKSILRCGNLAIESEECNHSNRTTAEWRSLFDQFDPEGFGEILWPEFLLALKSPEFSEMIEPGKLELLQEMACLESRKCNAITFQHFLNIMSGKRSRSFKCAVHQRDREVWSGSDYHLLPFDPARESRVTRMARLIADEFLTDERDRKYYADHYKCLPPPLFIISVTLIELGVFTYYTMWHGEVSSSGPLPIDSPFVYRPDKRQEVWRFLLYMVLHAGWVHLMFNLLVQLLVGLPLEMVHGSLRIGCVYMAGVLAGSLGTSVFDPDVYLVGASGGVYALLAAHLANVLLNYNNMEFGLVRLLGVFLIASVDVGFAIYDRYAAIPLAEGSPPPVSYVAHLTGALAGLTIGLVVLKNFDQKLREQMLWWLALGIYGACTIFAVLFNLFHPKTVS